MSPAPDRSWLDLLRTQAERFAQVVEHGDPAREVISCPGWTLRDLTDHLGGVHQWAAHAVVEGDPSLDPEPAPPADAAALAAWYRRYATTLVDVLAARPAEAPAWTLDRDDRTAGFWRRRQVHEVTMHLWDAEHALGRAQPIEPELAWDGVAEVVDILYPRQVRLGRTSASDDRRPAHAIGPRREHRDRRRGSRRRRSPGRGPPENSVAPQHARRGRVTLDRTAVRSVDALRAAPGGLSA